MVTNNQGWNLKNSYRKLPEIFYTTPRPTPVQKPKLVVFNKSLATSLGLDANALQTEEGVAIFSGNKLPEGSKTLAQAYAGHQFGAFTRLGDGRAIMLGEQITPQGERLDIQLKGSGRTMYSRGGDGRATLGPMLREYLISEAMHALNIPTTRGLAVVTTGESVFRETELPGAILTRVASSHLRVGTFQYAVVWGDVDALQALADYAISRHFPEIKDNKNPYLSLLEEIIKRQAALVAKWQLFGFIHGVMNTDNMTISGETIDYGPCAFMNSFDTKTVFSSIDTEGRYAYGNQPSIANWNLARFAETLLPLLDNDQDHAIRQAEEAINRFPEIFNTYWLDGMRAKLGIFNKEKEDQELVSNLLDAMKKYKADYTDTFLALTFNKLEGMTLFHSEEFLKWHNRWLERLKRQEEKDDKVHELMRNNNPAIIPRNHLVEEALDAAVENKDYSVMEQLLDVLSEPFAHTAKQAEYAKVPVPSTPYQTFCGT